MALGREAILNAKGRLKREEVHVPEWADGDDDIVIVRELTGAEVDAFDQSLTKQRPKFGPEGGKVIGMETVDDLDNITARFVALAVIDEDGNRLFTAGDAIALGELSSAALNRVYKAASALSRVDKDDKQDAEENSGAGEHAGSTSESPATSD